MNNQRGRVHISVRNNTFGFGIGLLVHTVGQDGEVSKIATNVSFADVTDDMRNMVWEPTLEIDRENAAQSLMDDLWNLGVRPTSEGTSGQFAAQKAHLEDIRKVAFAALKKTGVEITP